MSSHATDLLGLCEIFLFFFYIQEEFAALILLCGRRLRTLNLTKNRLTSLPPLNANLDLNKVQELYLSRNSFTNSVMRVVSGYSRLKVLHLEQNELTDIHDE